MHKEWNRKIVSGVIAHFYNGFKDEDISVYYEGQTRNPDKPESWVEVRLTSIRWRPIDTTQWLCRLAVNILCSTPSGLDVEEGSDLYAIEDIVGMAESLFTAIYVEGLGCLALDDSMELQDTRPRQLNTATDLKQDSVTGFYLLRIEKENQ